MANCKPLPNAGVSTKWTAIGQLQRAWKKAYLLLIAGLAAYIPALYRQGTPS
jgi:hypothetical protein